MFDVHFFVTLTFLITVELMTSRLQVISTAYAVDKV